MRRIAAVASIVAAGAALAADGPRTGPSAYGDWRVDAPGVRRLITPADLPPPYATPSTANVSSRVARPSGAAPRAPPGFSVDLLASGLSSPRAIRAAPNGDMFVAESGAGRVLVFGGEEAKAAPARPHVFATGLPLVYGIAFYPPGPDPRWVYVATVGSVRRIPYRNGDLEASRPAETVVPSSAGAGRAIGRAISLSRRTARRCSSRSARRPTTRNGADRPKAAEVAAGPLGASFGEERDRADVLAFDPEGGRKRVYRHGAAQLLRHGG